MYTWHWFPVCIKLLGFLSLTICWLLLFISSYDQAEAQEVQKPKGFECVGGLMADEAVALFQGFYESGNQNGKSGALQFELDEKFDYAN